MFVILIANCIVSFIVVRREMMMYKLMCNSDGNWRCVREHGNFHYQKYYDTLSSMQINFGKDNPEIWSVKTLKCEYRTTLSLRSRSRNIDNEKHEKSEFKCTWFNLIFSNHGIWDEFQSWDEDIRNKLQYWRNDRLNLRWVSVLRWRHQKSTWRDLISKINSTDEETAIVAAPFLRDMKCRDMLSTILSPWEHVEMFFERKSNEESSSDLGRETFERPFFLFLIYDRSNFQS